MPASLRLIHEINENIGAVRIRYDAFNAQCDQTNGAIPGDCNRLNDYVRELRGFLQNLESRLEAAGR